MPKGGLDVEGNALLHHDVDGVVLFHVVQLAHVKGISLLGNIYFPCFDEHLFVFKLLGLVLDADFPVVVEFDLVAWHGQHSADQSFPVFLASPDDIGYF